MKLGEVCLLTNDVVRLANFYKWLLGVENGSNDEVHQFIIAEETALTVFNDGTGGDKGCTNVSLAFTVQDIFSEYDRLVGRGVDIVEMPTVRPWGTINMRFRDPDGNVIYLRQFK